jgi:hypothetical protein
MKFYFTPAQAPELARLTRGQRKAVLRCALEAFFGEDPSRGWSAAPWLFGGLLGGALAGCGVAAAAGSSHHWLLGAAIGGVAGAVLGNFIATHLMTELLRPYLRRVLEERGEELARVN